MLIVVSLEHIFNDSFSFLRALLSFDDVTCVKWVQHKVIDFRHYVWVYHHHVCQRSYGHTHTSRIV